MRFKRFIAESQAKVAYHGTSSISAKDILKHGFSLKHVGSMSGAVTSGVAVSTKKEIADEFADWAAQAGGKPVTIKIDLTGLRIMPGKEMIKLWDKLGSVDAALKVARKNFDAAEMYDEEQEVGIEEFQILIFNPKKVKIIRE